jgi:hypothetical protein
MGDDLSKRGPQDASRINIHERYEVDYWTARFGCSKAELVAAVEAAGTNAKACRSAFQT